MDTHDIHGIDVGFHGGASEVKGYLRADKHITQDYFKEAEKHGKTHFEIEGKKFTMIHKDGDYSVRPSN